MVDAERVPRLSYQFYVGSRRHHTKSEGGALQALTFFLLVRSRGLHLCDTSFRKGLAKDVYVEWIDVCGLE